MLGSGRQGPPAPLRMLRQEAEPKGRDRSAGRQRDVPMFQVPMKMVIMSGSGCSECLFFICCRSWQKPSLFWGWKGDRLRKASGPLHATLAKRSVSFQQTERGASKEELPGGQRGKESPH